MSTTYETDVVAWAQEQAALLRSGQLSAIDIEHIAEEIEDVGRNEQRELASRMAVLLSHLLKWQFQPDRRGASWKTTIDVQRRLIARRLERTPSLKPMLSDAGWIEDMWADARHLASEETAIGFAIFPESCPWVLDQVMAQDFLPD